MISPFQGFDDDLAENPGLRLAAAASLRLSTASLRPGLSEDALAGLKVRVKFRKLGCVIAPQD
jgi:hypothetical protein